MKKIAALTFASLAMASTSFATASAADIIRDYPEQDISGGVKIGYLSCDIGGGVGYVLGSAKSLSCTFNSSRRGAAPDYYTGTVRKFGVDLGFTTRGRLVWAVFAPTAGYHKGALGGVYHGATTEATVGAGIGSNVLFGGTRNGIDLQTISVQGQIGLNVAATGTSITLNPS